MIKETNTEDPRYKIDKSESVEVYRNLHKDCYSIKQNGLVKGHAYELTMLNCTFHVSETGRDRVRSKKRKEVHAWVKGTLTDHVDLDSCNPTFDQKVHYDPYLHDEFVSLVGEKIGSDQWVRFVPIKNAKSIVFLPHGMWKL